MIDTRDVPSLLAFWDTYTTDYVDQWVRDYTGEIICPMRLLVLKTFLSAKYRHKGELEHVLKTFPLHPAIIMVQRARMRLESLKHQLYYQSFSRSIGCCDKWGRSSAGYVCEHCMTNMCGNCDDGICPQLLNNFLTQMCRINTPLSNAVGEMENYLNDDPAHDMNLEILWDE